MFSEFTEGFAGQLASYAFERGKGNVFRRHSPEGDILIVELQVSSDSTPELNLFYINIALVLAAKWECDRQRRGLPPPSSRDISTARGDTGSRPSEPQRNPSAALALFYFVEKPASTHNSVPTRAVWAHANSWAENGRHEPSTLRLNG